MSFTTSKKRNKNKCKENKKLNPYIIITSLPSRNILLQSWYDNYRKMIFPEVLLY